MALLLAVEARRSRNRNKARTQHPMCRVASNDGRTTQNRNSNVVSNSGKLGKLQGGGLCRVLCAERHVSPWSGGAEPLAHHAVGGQGQPGSWSSQGPIPRRHSQSLVPSRAITEGDMVPTSAPSLHLQGEVNPSPSLPTLISTITALPSFADVANSFRLKMDTRFFEYNEPSKFDTTRIHLSRSITERWCRTWPTSSTPSPHPQGVVQPFLPTLCFQPSLPFLPTPT